jgi:hypothetical protein
MRREVQCLAVALVSAVSLAAASDSGWSVVATPNIGSLGNALNGVAVASSSSAFAVGHHYDQGLAAYRTLALRWNGSSWQASTTPNVGNGYNELYSVSAPFPDDAWAVGYSRQDQYSPSHPLAVHWNGAAWQVVTTGVAGSGQLLGTSALSADEAWAVGSLAVGTTGLPLALHWDGVAWSKAQVPNPSPYYTVLTAVSALTPDDVWAVGYTHVGDRSVTLTEHWDGAAWSVVPSPSPGTQADYLRGVVAVAPDDVWAVGSAQGVGSLILHWNGNGWRSMRHPGGGDSLWALAALDSDDVWAAGYVLEPGSGSLHTRIEHWNGLAWSLESTPNPGLGPALFGAAAGDGVVWSVGLSNDGTTDRTLSLRRTVP